MVVVDKLTKASHFILVKSMCKVDAIAKIFMKEIFRLHGLPKAPISDRDAKFTSNFWKILFVYLGTKLNFDTAYHLQTDGKTERVNQVLEALEEISTQNGPFNPNSNSMSSCVS